LFNISPFVLLVSILGTLSITPLILSPAEHASEKYFMFNKLAPNPLFHMIIANTNHSISLQYNKSLNTCAQKKKLEDNCA